MRLAERTRLLRASPTMALDARAKELMRSGKSIISFAVGEPDFDTPDHVKEAAVEAIAAGRSKYTPVAGIPELREAIAERFLREQGVRYDPSGVVVTAGAKQALYELFQVLLDPGDEVIIPAPYWVTYPDQVVLAGGVPVVVPVGMDRRFAFTAEDFRAAITEKTRVLVLNSPQNPAGVVLGPDEIVRIADLAVERDIVIISDEVYAKLIYDGAVHRSPASVSREAQRQTIVVDAMSKSFAMTGWRIGYLLTEDRKVASAVADLQSQSTSNPNSVGQYAALRAVQSEDVHLPAMIAAYTRRRDSMEKGLAALPGFRVDHPRGAFYCFPEVRGVFGRTIGGRDIRSSDDLAALFLEEAGVAAVPGTGFGMPDYLRFSYATSDEKIEEGLARIRAALEG